MSDHSYERGVIFGLEAFNSESEVRSWNKISTKSNFQIKKDLHVVGLSFTFIFNLHIAAFNFPLSYKVRTNSSEPLTRQR